MRKLILIPVLLLVASCATTSFPEKLIGVNHAITSTVNLTTISLKQDRISPDAACRVSAYAKVAGRAVDEAWEHWAIGQPETASQMLRAASSALNGTSQEALKAAEVCK